MLMINKKRLLTGIIGIITFFIIFILMYSPFFNGKNGLQYADEIFNQLSKGSSYFIPEISKSLKKLPDIPFKMILKKEIENQDKIISLLKMNDMKLINKDKKVQIIGNLKTLLQNITEESDRMYHNDGGSLSLKYGYPEKKVLKCWWLFLNILEKKMIQDNKILEAKIITKVRKKAIEPAYNFYKIKNKRIINYVGIIIVFLLFYVGYTLWWGYSIHFLFEGIGLNAKKIK